DLIASLGKADQPSVAPQTPPASKPAPVPGTEAPAAAGPSVAANTQTTYYLQAGAFRSAEDAESVKARILMLGLPVGGQQGQSNGNTLTRGRVGPFQGVDEMNRSRARLGAEHVEASVVRP